MKGGRVLKLLRIFTDPNERRAYAYILSLTLPIVIQNLFSAAVGSADVLMLNSVGQASISAVSLANNYAIVLTNVFSGLACGVSILSAQYWGKKDIAAIEKIQGIALRFVLLGALIFALPSLFIPCTMMKVFTTDSELISIGGSYLRIVGTAHIFWGISEACFATMRSMERVKICTTISVSTLLLNVLLNAVFIFGWLGMPKLGAAGVALATAISRTLQFIACICFASKNGGARLNLRNAIHVDGNLRSDFLRVSLPVLANTVSWSIGFSMYSAILGHLNTDVIAANSIVSVVRSFGLVFCWAISSSVGIYVGKDLGANDMDGARKNAARAMVLTIVSGVIGGLTVLSIMPFAIRAASISPVAKGYLRTMLIINSVYIMGTAVNSTLIGGLFRAGGDSRFGFICDIIDMWGYAVPLGFIAAFVFKLPPMVVYLLLCTDEFVKWPWVFKRYRQEKWLKNLTR